MGDGRLEWPCETTIRRCDGARYRSYLDLVQATILVKERTSRYLDHDLVLYTDVLLAGLGLQSYNRSLVDDLIEPCWASDQRGTVSEFRCQTAIFSY